MEKFIYIDDISIQDNKIYLDSGHKIEKIKMSNEMFSIYYNVEKNVIDLERVIRENKIVLFEERLYTLYTVNENGKYVVLVSKSHIDNEEYVAKSFNINVEGCRYFIDIYINENSNIQIFVKKEEEGCQINYKELHFSNGKLLLDVYLKSGDIIKEAKAVLIGNNCDEIFQFPYESKENSKLRFNIDLIPLLSDKNYKFKVLIIINDKVYSLKVPRELNLKNLRLEKNNFLKFVTSSVDVNGKLSINLDHSNISVKPTITSVEYNEDLTVKGKINSNINLSLSKLIRCNINLFSNDGKVSVSYPVNVENDYFILKLESKDIRDLKESYQGLWGITFEVLINEELVLNSPLFPTGKGILYSNEILAEEEHIVSEFVVNGEDDSIKLNITNNISIAKIMFVKVKGNKLRVRFRTVENVDTLLNNDLIKADIVVNDKKLKQYTIKKIGKKTFEVDYLTDNSKAIAEDIGKKGLKVLIKCNNKISCSKLNDIDKDTIFYSFFQRLQSSKKYKKLCSVAYNKLFLKMPIKKKRIMFESFLGRNISGNPKYLYNKLVKDGLDKKYELIWILNNLEEPVEGKCKKVKRKTLKYYYYMATSKYWIFNCRQADEIKKRKENIYLQTWHGTPLKKLGMDMDSVNMAGQTDINDYKQKFRSNTSTWDYLLAQNHYSRDIFKRAFAFDKTILEGYPANDILYTENNKESIDKIKSRLGIPKDKKVILYAPTWRDDNFYKKGHYRMDIQLDLDKMQLELGDQYVVLLRMHYLITNNINIDKYKGFVLNYSEGYDIQELYLVSDVLITDYSSVMFDYSNLKRPIIFFTYDIEQYRDSLRGFYFDFEEEAPGPLVTDTEGVIDSLKSLEKINEKYKEKQVDFYNKFCHIDDGQAAKNILKEIL